MVSSQFPLTSKEQQVYDFIVQFQTENGNHPNGFEIAHRFGLKSPRSSYHYIDQLFKKGYLVKENSITNRNYKLLKFKK